MYIPQSPAPAAMEPMVDAAFSSEVKNDRPREIVGRKVPVACSTAAYTP